MKHNNIIDNFEKYDRKKGLSSKSYFLICMDIAFPMNTPIWVIHRKLSIKYVGLKIMTYK